MSRSPRSWKVHWLDSRQAAAPLGLCWVVMSSSAAECGFFPGICRSGVGV